MITLYHRTTEDIARIIIADGFRDGSGYYLTCNLHTGVWVSDRPLGELEGPTGSAIVRIELAQAEREIGSYEWIEDGKPYREWLMPAKLLNLGKIVIQEIEPEFGQV